LPARAAPRPGWQARAVRDLAASRAGEALLAQHGEQLLQAQPDAKEIQVERVKFLRYGEARGNYDQVVATLNRSDPHGR